jgi:hypothetical protein
MTSILIKKQVGGLRVFSLVGGWGLRGKMFENHCLKCLLFVPVCAFYISAVTVYLHPIVTDTHEFKGKIKLFLGLIN